MLADNKIEVARDDLTSRSGVTSSWKHERELATHLGLACIRRRSSVAASVRTRSSGIASTYARRRSIQTIEMRIGYHAQIRLYVEKYTRARINSRRKQIQLRQRLCKQAMQSANAKQQCEPRQSLTCCSLGDAKDDLNALQ